MKCKQIHNKFDRYADGTLRDKEREQVQDHLTGCQSCRTLYDEFLSTMELTGKRKELEPNPFLYTRIKEKLREAEKERNIHPVFATFKRSVHPVLVSLLLVLAVIGGIELGNAYSYRGQKRIVVEKSTAYYLNDMQQERLEMTILNN